MDHPSNYFLRTIPLLQVYVRASVGLFARTYRPSEPPNDGAMARESALAVPPLSPAHHQIQQLWAAPLRARGSPFSRFVRPYPLSAFHSLLPFHPSSVGGSRPQSEASLGRRFCRRILVRRAVTFNRPYNESSYESHEFIYGRGRLKVPAQSER